MINLYFTIKKQFPAILGNKMVDSEFRISQSIYDEQDMNISNFLFQTILSKKSIEKKSVENNLLKKSVEKKNQ